MIEFKSSNITIAPTGLTLRQQSKLLEIDFEDGSQFSLPFEFLRVYSPSAEVRGHGPGQETLQTGKRKAEITDLEQVGNYAVRPIFSDGHDTGLYTWEYLFWLGANQPQLWEDYLKRLEEAGYCREGGRSVPMAVPSSNAGSCGGGGGGGDAAKSIGGGGCGH